MTFRNLPSQFFFFNDTATTEIYTLSLHDALPISVAFRPGGQFFQSVAITLRIFFVDGEKPFGRSEEHTSELQSRLHIVCRLLLEKKKTMCVTSFAWGCSIGMCEPSEIFRSSVETG